MTFQRLLAILAATMAMMAIPTAYGQNTANAPGLPTKVSPGGKDPASAIASAVTSLVPEARGMFAMGDEFAARLKRLDYRELLPMHITPANFLEEAQKIIKTNSAREIAGMSVQAGRLALQIEDVKLGYLKAKLCAGAGVAQLAQYGNEVEMGCKLIDLQQRLTSLQLKGLDMVDEHSGSK